MSGRECGLSVPSSARIYDYLFGGKDNYEVDRAIGDELLAVCPALGLNLRWMDAFVGRAVEYVAALGVRQFADLGCGYPRTPSPYARVQRAHAVHIDCDPVVAAHGNALLQSPTSLFIDADITETAALAGHLGMLLDLGRPVAAVLGSVLEYLPDPGRVLGELSKTLAPGSYVVISHITADWAPAVERLRDVLGACGIAFVPRGRDEIAAVLGDWEVVEPGVVPVHLWRPELVPIEVGGAPTPDAVCCYAVVGRI